jgi:hypothetical protein
MPVQRVPASSQGLPEDVVHRRLRLLLLVVAVLGAGLARAEAPARRARVEVALVDPLGREASLPKRISSWFDPETFRVEVKRAAYLDPRLVLHPAEGDVVYAWVTLGRADLLRFYFTTNVRAEGKVRYLVRALPLEHGLDEIALERVAEVVHLSTMALVESDRSTRREDVEKALGNEPPPGSAESAPDAPESAPPSLSSRGAAASSGAGDSPSSVPLRAPAATPSRPRDAASARASDRGDPPRRPARPGFALGYGGSYRGDEGFAHGPTVMGEVDLGRFGFGLRVHGYLPVMNTLPPITVRRYSVSTSLVGRVRFPVGPFTTVEVELGPGIDVVDYRPLRSDDPTVAIGAGETEGRPLVEGGACAVFGTAAPRVALCAELAVALMRTHYDVVVDGIHHGIGRPAPVSPALAAEARF